MPFGLVRCSLLKRVPDFFAPNLSSPHTRDIGSEAAHGIGGIMRVVAGEHYAVGMRASCQNSCKAAHRGTAVGHGNTLDHISCIGPEFVGLDDVASLVSDYQRHKSGGGLAAIGRHGGVELSVKHGYDLVECGRLRAASPGKSAEQLAEAKQSAAGVEAGAVGIAFVISTDVEHLADKGQIHPLAIVEAVIAAVDEPEPVAQVEHPLTSRRSTPSARRCEMSFSSAKPIM